VGWQFEDRLFPAFLDHPDRLRQVRIRKERARARHQPHGWEPNTPEGGDPRAMLRAMDREGIDVAVAFRTLASHFVGVDGLDPELSAAVCRAYNDWLAGFCATDRARLLPAAVIPLQDLGLAVEEARRGVRELGAVAVVVSNHPVNGRPWYDRTYDPLWAELERLGVPAAFHGFQLAYQDQLGRRFLDNFALGHAAAHPVETMLALGGLLTGGTFVRFPGLRAAFLESNSSWVPWWLWALDERMEKFGDYDHVPLAAPPSEYFRRHCWVSVEPDEALVRHVLPAIGDNIVFSSDWPHDDSSFPFATDTFLALEGVPAESKRKILWDNCARLYGLDPGLAPGPGTRADH